MTNHKDETTETLDKLKEMIQGGDETLFTAKEIQTLKRMIDFYESFVAFGRVGIWIRNFLLFIGSLILIWSAANSSITAFIKRVAG